MPADTLWPDLEDTRAYLRVPSTLLSDGDLSRIRLAAIADQVMRCRIDEPLPEPLAQAYLRRVQREVAARNLPLGMVGTEAAEFQPTRLPYLDSLVEEHERAYRLQVLA